MAMLRLSSRLTLLAAAPFVTLASSATSASALRLRPTSPTASRARLLSSAAAKDAKLALLRAAMADAGVDALLVPSADPHLSEYVHPHYQRRAYLSGFTGSAGTVLVTQHAALLWTDGRYFLQAEEELPAGWSLMRSLQPGVPTLEAYLAAELPAAAAVGIDPMLHSVQEAEKLLAALGEGRTLRLLDANLVDGVWQQLDCRPPPPRAAARALPRAVAGVSRVEKLSRLCDGVAAAAADGALVSALDEVAWLLNVRGADVPHCPLLQAHVLVRPPHAEGALPRCVLYVDESKLSASLTAELAEDGVEIAPYEDIVEATRAFQTQGQKLLLDPSSVSYGLRTAAGDAAVLRPSSIPMAKACKNEAELAGMLQAHLVDGAALAHFFAWLEQTVAVERRPITEAQLATRLAEFRAAQPGFLDLSFPTIAGVGPNGAIIHYNPLHAARPARLDGSQLVLLDSGGQYECGTTDVTRTFHLGTPTRWQVECFTRVLKGHIALDAAVFPEDTPGPALDALARLALWQAGLDYLHGTGHGVGAALNVHEGPHSISTRYTNTVGLKEGMVVSNEPGYYEEGAFGIRIENLLVARRAEVAGVGGKPFNERKYLGFTQLTHVPIQTSLIDPSLLTKAEIEWLDSYHSRVWERISPLLERGSAAYEWLRKSTQPLQAEKLVGSLA